MIVHFTFRRTDIIRREEKTVIKGIAPGRSKMQTENVPGGKRGAQDGWKCRYAKEIKL